MMRIISQNIMTNKILNSGKTIFVFAVAFLILGWVSFEMGIFSPAYIFGFLAGSLEVFVILLFLFLVIPRLSKQARKKLTYYSIQLILGPVFVLSILSSLFISGENRVVVFFIAWTSAFLFWWTLVALIIKLRWWFVLVALGIAYVYSNHYLNIPFIISKFNLSNFNNSNHQRSWTTYTDEHNYRERR